MTDTTNWQAEAEAERLRALLDVSEQARQSALRALADATERGIDGQAEAERLRAELAQAREVLRSAREMLIGDPHLYRGQCPQPNDTYARDPECPACATLVRIDAALAAKEE